MAWKSSLEIEGGDHGIVDVEQHAQAVAFARELLLICLRRSRN